MTRPILRTAAAVGLTSALLVPARADTIVQTVGNIDWNAAMWGDPAAAPVLGNDYVSATGVQDERFRISADGASSTFGGDSLTVNTGSRALMKNQNGAIATINGDLILAGGRLSYGPNGGPHTGTLDVVNFVVMGTGSFIDPSGAVTQLTIDGTLTGSGDLLLTPENGTNIKTVVFTDVGDYTGNLTVASTILLDFDVDHVFTGTLNLNGTGALNVDQTLTFDAGKLLVDGEPVPPGTYAGNDLFDLGENFYETGGTLIISGSLPDADGDGLPDYYEDLIIAFDPDDAVDGYEDIAGPNDAPATTDFDADGRSDADEYADGVTENQTDPTDPDGDDDGLLDGAEVAGTDNAGNPSGYGPTDPLNANSDGDRFDDGDEVRYGSDPNDPLDEPGDPIPLVNGSFEDPVLPVYGEGLSIAGGTVPGWSAVLNDFYVLDYFSVANINNPNLASDGEQFATAGRDAPVPEADAATFEGGIDASMVMRQDIDVSSLATPIDEGAKTVLLDFDWRENDGADQGVITVSFLDGSGEETGHASAFETSGSVQAWTTTRLAAFPPAGTRTVRVTVAAHKTGTGTSSVRNVHVDNFIARLVDFDADGDGLPDPWEDRYGLDSNNPGDATVSSDDDSLTNLEEFALGTDPTLADTDSDGIHDDAEVAAGTDPLDPNSPAPEIRLQEIQLTKDGEGAITEVRVTFSGLNPAVTYQLMRSTDLTDFSETADTFQPASPTDSFFDFNPPAGGAFYRLESP
ncbi:hypothetical protein [Haloferula sargassicola]